MNKLTFRVPWGDRIDVINQVRTFKASFIEMVKVLGVGSVSIDDRCMISYEFAQITLVFGDEAIEKLATTGG